MYVLRKGFNFLYKTHRGDYIFASEPNMFFHTEEQATNFLHYNSTSFDVNGVSVFYWGD